VRLFFFGRTEGTDEHIISLKKSRVKHHERSFAEISDKLCTDYFLQPRLLVDVEAPSTHNALHCSTSFGAIPIQIVSVR